MLLTAQALPAQMLRTSAAKPCFEALGLLAEHHCTRRRLTSSQTGQASSHAAGSRVHGGE